MTPTQTKLEQDAMKVLKAAFYTYASDDKYTEVCGWFIPDYVKGLTIGRIEMVEDELIKMGLVVAGTSELTEAGNALRTELLTN